MDAPTWTSDTLAERDGASSLIDKQQLEGLFKADAVNEERRRRTRRRKVYSKLTQ